MPPNVLTIAVQWAIKHAPCSVASLADAAGVPQSTLARIQTGERNATPAVAAKLAAALDRWGAHCLVAARKIRTASRRVGIRKGSTQ